MYDIISFKSEGVKVVLTVVEDTHEKELMNKYKEQFDAVHSTSSGKKQNSLAKDFFAFKYLGNKFISVVIPESELNRTTRLLLKTIEGFTSYSTPPPDFA